MKLNLVKITILLSILVISYSCSSTPTVDNKAIRLEKVKTLYPNSKIYKHIGNDLNYYIIDSTGVKCVNFFSLFEDINMISVLVEVK